MSLIRVLFCLAAFVVCVPASLAAEQPKENAINLVLSSNDGYIDVYVANAGRSDVTLPPYLRVYGPSRELRFEFYEKNGKCSYCTYKMVGSAPFEMPSNQDGQVLGPQQIVGTRVKLMSLISMYHLKKDVCYGVFAEYRSDAHAGAAFIDALTSNVIKICI